MGPALPAFSGVLDLLREGVISGAIERNREYAASFVRRDTAAGEDLETVLYDPQTSGGLLMAVQYARNRFAIPALAPLVYNAGIIVGGLALGRRFGMDGRQKPFPGGKVVVELKDGNLAVGGRKRSAKRAEA